MANSTAFARTLQCRRLIALPLLTGAFALQAGAAPIDTVRFGEPASEKAHAVDARRSEVVTGGLDQSARRLLPNGGTDWQGGTLQFDAQVDPAKPTYLTARFWGGEAAVSRMVLFCGGKQVGYFHLGDIDALSTPGGQPSLPGRFFYVTTPLPTTLTKGQSHLAFEIRGMGPIWGYGQTFDKYQKPMTEPTASVYAVYTHIEGFFAPPTDEPQGSLPADPPRRATPGVEVLAQAKKRVNDTINGILADAKPIDQLKIWFLARAVQVPWTTAANNPKAVDKILSGIDAFAVKFKADPTIAENDKAMYNGDWFGVGPIGAAVSLLDDRLTPVLDQPVAGLPGSRRRDAWAAMLVASRDHHRRTRRQYTNQSMISDTYGIYQCNRGVAVLRPDLALPEADARKYLYESAAVSPWLGSETNGVPQKPLGDDYYQLTKKGLTKELGFVGYYGEVLDWMTAMYDATRPAPGRPGDEKLKAQLVKAAKARAFFRYPEVDDDGFRTMRAEAVVGWRDMGHYPGDVTYAQRSTWDAGALGAAAATLDPALIGSAQQMFDDNQFFARVAEQMKTSGLRATAGLLDTPEEYELIRKQPRSAQALPMSRGGADVAFADEEDGVVAVRNGDDILYVSLYWRARFGINDLARVHHVTPRFDRIAVVREQTKFTPSGQTYTRPNWTNFGFGNGGLKYPASFESAHAGETMPIAKIPAGVKFKPGDENAHAGRGDFYTLRYGPYLIGMNCTADRTFDLAVPAEFASARDLVSGRSATSGAMPVPPQSTAVLYRRDSE